MPECRQCGKQLSNNEMGIYKKMVGRYAVDYLCKGCLAKAFDCREELIDEKIQQFKEMGCMLFT